MRSVVAARDGWLSRAVKALALGALLAITYLSLAPVQDMVPRPGYPRPAEHFAAYCVGWALVSLAFPRWRWPIVMAGALAMAGTYELLQHFSPGRTPSPYDFAGSALGALAGIAIARLCSAFVQARRLAARA